MRDRGLVYPTSWADRPEELMETDDRWVRAGEPGYPQEQIPTDDEQEKRDA